MLISTIFVTSVPGMTPVRSSNGSVRSSFAHSLSTMFTPPLGMTLCALVSAVKYASVFAASMATKMASTDRIKNFRFIAFTPLRLYLQLFLTLFLALQTIGEHLPLP